MSLNKEGKRWALKIFKESKCIREYNKQLRMLLHQSSGGQKDETGAELGVQEIELKIEELKQNIRKSETSKLKAEARVELLIQAGVNVDDWLKGGDSDTLGPLDMTGGGLSRAGSTLSVKTDISGNVDDGCSEFYDSDYNDDVSDTSTSGFGTASMTSTAVAATSRGSVGGGDDTASEPRDTSSLGGGAGGGEGETTSLGFTPMHCTALYNYTAQNADELSIVEQEVLEVIGEGDGDGWVKARNSQGQEGYVPQAYVEVEGGEAIPSSIYPAPTSFSSVDYTMPDWGDDEGLVVGEPVVDALPPPPEVTVPVIVENHFEADQNGGDGELLCRAVYDYEATCPEELTFVEGQIIRIVSKHVHDVDDGWWQGTVDGQVGIFPSLVVEELRSNGEPESLEEEEEDVTSPPGSAPPTFSPPPMPQFLSAPALVIITQPTPEIERAGDKFGDVDEAPPGDDDDDVQAHTHTEDSVKKYSMKCDPLVQEKIERGAHNEHIFSGLVWTSGPGDCPVKERENASTYSYATPDFGMELSEEQQSQYQTQFSATDNNANETITDSKEENGDEEPSLRNFEVPDIVASSTVVDAAQVITDSSEATESDAAPPSVVETETADLSSEALTFPSPPPQENMEEDEVAEKHVDADDVAASPEPFPSAADDVAMEAPPGELPPPPPGFEEHTG